MLEDDAPGIGAAAGAGTGALAEAMTLAAKVDGIADEDGEVEKNEVELSAWRGDTSNDDGMNVG